MKNAMTAIIKKDFGSLTCNRRLFVSLWIVPLVLTIFLPSVFVFLIHFAPNDPDLQTIFELLPSTAQTGNLEKNAVSLILNCILPGFFLIIPIMTASIMAANSFVGEKEKRTLETLLYCPLSVRQIFRAKVLAAFLLSMIVSLISFCAMMLALELEVFFLIGSLLLPGISWLILLLIVSPAISLIAVTLIVRVSAKSQSVEESQQSAAFLVVPPVLLIVGQFTGVMLLNAWILLALGAVCALLAWLLLKNCMRRFTYEMLLK